MASRNNAFGVGWQRDRSVFNSLRNASEEDYYNLFKQNHGDSMNQIVKSCTQFNSWNDENKIIGQKAYSALIRIGKESKINAIRVKKYGLDIEQVDMVQH